MSKISVIVPVYNVKNYLKRCIDSILTQTYEDFDLIIVDDGSTDGCGSICDDYVKMDSRIRVVHQENQGQAEARNIGIEMALKTSDSEWITFIDSDDWVHKDYLKVLYESAVNNNVELSICNCLRTSSFDIDTQIINVQETIFDSEDFWCYRQYGSPCTKLYKKKHLEKIRFPKGIIYEDVFFTYRLIFMQDKVVYTDTPLYYYYMRLDSTTHTEWSPRDLSQLAGLKEQLEFFDKNGFKSAYNVTLKNYLLKIEMQLCKAKDQKKIYYKEYTQLVCLLKTSLIRYYKYFPMKENVNLYRNAFPVIVKIYKKCLYGKEILLKSFMRH